jgi:hypothetical protein
VIARDRVIWFREAALCRVRPEHRDNQRSLAVFRSPDHQITRPPGLVHRTVAFSWLNTPEGLSRQIQACSTSMREAVLQRGVRADEAAPGSGLGLAIVRDLAELYGGTISLEDSPLGGLRARLRLPA